MKEAHENQGNGPAGVEVFSPRSRVMGLNSPHFTAFPQETPMKPSQTSNRPNYPPKRVLPLQTPESCKKEQFGLLSHPRHLETPLDSLGYTPDSSINVDTSAKPSPTPWITEKEKLDSSQTDAQEALPISSEPPLVTQGNKHSSSHVPFPPAFLRITSSPCVRGERIQPASCHAKAPPTQKHQHNFLKKQDLPDLFSNCLSQKRPRESEHCYKYAKKQCPNESDWSDSVIAAANSCTSPVATNIEYSSDFEASPQKVTDSGPGMEVACGDSMAPYEQPLLLSSPKRCSAKGLSVGVKRVYLSSTIKNQVSPCIFSKSGEEKGKTIGQRNHKTCKSVGSAVFQKDLIKTPQTTSISSKSGHTSSVVSVLPDRTLSKNNPKMEKIKSGSSTPKQTIAANSSLPGAHSSKRSKVIRKKSTAALDDIDQLFTPDLPTCVVIPTRTSAKPKTNEETVKSPSSEKASHFSAKCSTSGFGSPSHKTSVESLNLTPTSTRTTYPLLNQTTHISSATHKTTKHKMHSNSGKSPISENAFSPASGSSGQDAESNCPKTSNCRSAESSHATLSSISLTVPAHPGFHVASFYCKTSKTHSGASKSPASEKGSSSASSCSAMESPQAAAMSGNSLLVSQPTILLKRIKLENKNLHAKDKRRKASCTVSSSKDECSQFVGTQSPQLFSSKTSCNSKTGPPASIHTHLSKQTAATTEDYLYQTCSEDEKEEGSIDMELDLGQSFVHNIDLTQSSESSEEEQLMSFQEMMEPTAKVPQTPKKAVRSEPGTPRRDTSQAKPQLPTVIKSSVYKNNLDEMVKEMNNIKKAKEVESQLLTACKEDLLGIPEFEELEESQEEGISTEQQEFLRRYSLMSSVIREVPPGEVVFNLERFGCIFDQNTLQLRQCNVDPQTTAQKALLWSSPAQLRLHVITGLFQEAFSFVHPCPAQVTRFLFKVMSVHSERMVSEKILHILCDIACSAAYQIVENGNQQFEVWVPSLADVTLVLMNMGVAFVTLFPFEKLQPTFTEGDLLDDVYIKPESPPTKKEQVFSEHNCTNVLKYLSYCTGLCPRAFSDDELLLLLTVVERICLDTRRILQSNVEVSCLLYKIVNNFRNWEIMMPRICLALTDLTDDHQNMCLVVQLLPDHKRGKELRRHLSLCMISRLLDGNCTYRPTQTEFQLADLRPYLPRMQPSTLLRNLQHKHTEEDVAILDQQAYYLCYSLLTLANEACNYQVFPPHQKEQLLFLSSELETRVKCDIRESEKCLYRSKLKDLVARIYTKWQMLIQRTRPLNGQLYDYWQPVDTLSFNQENEETTVLSDIDEESDHLVIDENYEYVTSEEEDTVEEETEEAMDKDSHEMGNWSKNDINSSKQTTEPATCNQTMPEIQPDADQSNSISQVTMENRIAEYN